MSLWATIQIIPITHLINKVEFGYVRIIKPIMLNEISIRQKHKPSILTTMILLSTISYQTSSNTKLVLNGHLFNQMNSKFNQHVNAQIVTGNKPIKIIILVLGNTTVMCSFIIKL